MRSVSVVGIGQLPVEKQATASLRELGVRATRLALEDAGIDRVDALYAGNMLADELQGQKHVATLIASEAGLHGLEALQVRAATASGAAALRMACLAVASGEAELAVAVGFEKMSAAPPTSALAKAMDAKLEVPTGATLISQNADLMRTYLERYDVPYEGFVNFAINAHRNAATNPHARFQKEVSAEEVLESRIVNAPIRLFDCSPICDGGAAVVLAPTDSAAAFTDQPVRVLAGAVATDWLRVEDRPALLAVEAARLSAQKAYAQAGLTPDDVDFFEVHDAFSIMACLLLEAAGFAKPGEGWRMAAEGEIFREGRLPIATLGGLKARGHPIGATALYQVCEIVQQLTGHAGPNQLPHAEIGMLQSVGGAAATVITHLFGVSFGGIEVLVNPAPLAETAEALRSGELDFATYVNRIAERIATVEPQVQSLVSEPVARVRLLNEARRLQERFPDPADRPLLYGILVGVKDIIHVDGFLTRAGSNLPPSALEGPEATVVTMLREAGALILGKTVTTEFAWFDPGPTRNPHNLQHTPGGSSSGSAAAVAAGLCPLAIGTQTIGSVIRPAAFCGIVGFKPSFGRIPRVGVIMFSESADHVGLFTQDVAGMRLAANVVCDDWKLPARDQKLEGRPVLGVPEGPYLEQASEEGLAAFRNQLQQLEAAGYSVGRVPAFDDIATINQRHRRMIAAEVAQVHAEWFARYQSLYRPRTAAVIREGQQISADELAEARAGREVLRSELERQMQSAGIDLWVGPAAPGPAPRGIDATGDPIMNLPWTYTGLPAVTVPAGRAENGLPLGLQCVASFRADEPLLAWAEPIAEILAESG